MNRFAFFRSAPTALAALGLSLVLPQAKADPFHIPNPSYIECFPGPIVHCEPVYMGLPLPAAPRILNQAPRPRRTLIAANSRTQIPDRYVTASMTPAQTPTIQPPAPVPYRAPVDHKVPIPEPTAAARTAEADDTVANERRRLQESWAALRVREQALQAETRRIEQERTAARNRTTMARIEQEPSQIDQAPARYTLERTKPDLDATMQTKPVANDPVESEHPIAQRHPSHPDTVISPFDPEGEDLVDVKGLEPGSLALEPRTNRVFRIPL